MRSALDRNDGSVRRRVAASRMASRVDWFDSSVRLAPTVAPAWALANWSAAWGMHSPAGPWSNAPRDVPEPPWHTTSEHCGRSSCCGR